MTVGAQHSAWPLAIAKGKGLTSPHQVWFAVLPHAVPAITWKGLCSLESFLQNVRRARLLSATSQRQQSEKIYLDLSQRLSTGVLQDF